MKTRIFLIFVFCIIILSACSGTELRVSRGKAFKELALTMSNKKNILAEYENSEESGTDDFNIYAAYLLKKGVISEELSVKSTEGYLTYKEMKEISSKLVAKDEIENIYKKYREGSDVKESDFYKVLVYFNGNYPGAKQGKSPDIVLYDVSKYKKDIQKISTKDGKTYYGALSLKLDKYLDKKIKAFILDDEIIFVEKVTDNSVEYNNVLITDIENGKMEALVLNAKRDFKLASNLDAGEYDKDVIADIRLTKGVVNYIEVKNTKIEGKILAVGDNFVELEGYGSLSLSDSFVAFNKAAMARESVNRMMVGSNVHEFYIDKDKLVQAAVKINDYEYKRVRVLIMNDYFRVRHHNTITLHCDAGMVIQKELQDIHLTGSEDYSLNKDKLVNNERVIIKSADDNTPIQVTSLKMDIFKPSYKGYLEIVRRDDAIYLINDIEIEEYLKKVVPSEMPETYSLEALKAQAVAARTYTCRTMLNGSELRVLGANMDDSINYQVYGNKNTSEATDRAVLETAGKRVFYNGSFAETFYYSTSAGVSTDGTIWGAKAEDVPYLKSYTISKDKKTVNISTNSSFKKFIDKVDEEAYEKDYDFYRWKFETDNKILSEKNTKVGNILALNITKRGQGGIVKELEVIGEKGNYKVKGHNAVRAFLGNSSLTIEKNKGEKVSGFSSLPSSFFYIETSKPDNNNTIKFTIKGGGYGHGVGMSQNAANEMAKSGMTYSEIIGFFYENISIE